MWIIKTNYFINNINKRIQHLPLEEQKGIKHCIAGVLTPLCMKLQRQQKTDWELNCTSKDILKILLWLWGKKIASQPLYIDKETINEAINNFQNNTDEEKWEIIFKKILLWKEEILQ